MNYEDEKFIKVYTRDTAAWLALPWQCRGLMLEISRKIPQLTGELSLGRKGLETIAALLRADWSEIEPFVRELIADGRLEYDEAHQLIRDPQHVERQTAIASTARRSQDYREREKVAKPVRKPRKKKEKTTVTQRHATDTQYDAESLLDETRSDQIRQEQNPEIARAREANSESSDSVPKPTDSGRIEAHPTMAVSLKWTIGVPGLAALDRFEESVEKATGKPYSVDRHGAAQEHLCRALNKHGPQGPMMPALDWLRAEVAEWVKAEGGQSAVGWSTKAFLMWLNGGRKAFHRPAKAPESTTVPMTPYAPAKARSEPTAEEHAEAQKLAATMGLSFLDQRRKPKPTGTE